MAVSNLSNDCSNLDLTNQSQTNGSLHNLFITDKGKFKWKGNFADLQELLEQELGFQTEWSSPGGDAKKFENDRLVIWWYAETSSLTIKGIDSTLLKNKLALVAREERETDETNPDETNPDETKLRCRTEFNMAAKHPKQQTMKAALEILKQPLII